MHTYLTVYTVHSERKWGDPYTANSNLYQLGHSHNRLLMNGWQENTEHSVCGVHWGRSELEYRVTTGLTTSWSSHLASWNTEHSICGVYWGRSELEYRVTTGLTTSWPSHLSLWEYSSGRHQGQLFTLNPCEPLDKENTHLEWSAPHAHTRHIPQQLGTLEALLVKAVQLCLHFSVKP